MFKKITGSKMASKSRMVVIMAVLALSVTSIGSVAAPQKAEAGTPQFPSIYSCGALTLSKTQNKYHICVRHLQNYYKAKGWSVTVDQIYGDQTALLTAYFQMNQGIAVDGVVGPQTWSRILSY